MQRPPLEVLLCGLVSAMSVQSLIQGRPEVIDPAFHLYCDIGG